MKTQAQSEDHTFENKICNYVLVFFACAFIGWLWEVTLYFFRTGTFINRGVLHGPWLPIYGCGGLGIALFLRHFKQHPSVVFALSAIGCGVLEYFTGWYLETFKHLTWWDYGSEFLNLHGRICFGSILAFGICGLAITYLLYPTLIRLYDHLSLRPKKLICALLILIFFADFVYSSDVPNTGYGITDPLSSVIHSLPADSE